MRVKYVHYEHIDEDGLIAPWEHGDECSSCPRIEIRPSLQVSLHEDEKYITISTGRTPTGEAHVIVAYLEDSDIEEIKKSGVVSEGYGIIQ